MNKAIIAALALTAMVGCAKNEGDGLSTASGSVVTFTSASIDTKATQEGTWDAYEKIGITMYEYTGSAYALSSTDNLNIQYASTNDEDGATTATFEVYDDEAIIYPSSGNQVEFYAYYPYQAGMTEYLLFAADVSNQEDLSNIDFMVAKTSTSDYSNSVKLTFEHKFAKLSFSISSKEDLNLTGLKSISILGLNTKGSYDVRTGEQNEDLSENTTKIEVPFTYYDGDVTATAIVLPEKLESAATVTFLVQTSSLVEEAIVTKDRTFTITMSEETEFTAGYDHSYSISLGSVITDFSEVTISPWKTHEDQTDDLYTSETTDYSSLEE